MSLVTEIIARGDAGTVALRDDSIEITYEKLPHEIARRANQLRGLTCAALAEDNSVSWVLWDLAALTAGVALVPLPPFFNPAQRDHALRSAGCQALITAQGIIPLPQRPAHLPAGTAKITFTSGTTGTPRGVCLSESAMLATARAITGRLGTLLSGGTHCCVLPLAVLLENVAGVYATLLSGGTVVLPSLHDIGARHQNLRDNIVAAGAHSVILVPELLRLLIAQVVEKGPLPALRFVAVGGSKVAPELIAAARRSGLPAYEGYGLSECGSVVSLNTPGDERDGTCGRLLPHIIAHELNGEIIIDNPGFLGYVGAPHSGPFATGDIGNINSDCFVSISGRRKNVLITSYGRNISPEWVESRLLLQPEIMQAIVHGDAQAYLSALIVPSFAGADIDAAVRRANEGLPDYARVADIRLVPPFTVENGMLTGTGRPRRDIILTHHEKEKAMNFYDRLVKETESARRELYTVPQLVDGLKGDINRETYIAYLTEAYHHVRHTVRFLMAMGARLPDDKKWLHDAISEYIDEEKGHEEWILNDIAAAGADKEKARAATPNLETHVLVAYNYDYIARKNPVGFLGMVFMLESTSTQIANNGADAVRERLGLPKSAFSYLYSHGALDIEHMKFFEKTVNRVTDPADQAAIIEVASNAFRLFANVMRAIPHKQESRHAA